ncbi:hypothetical protein IPA_04420 [Ignicoccus pacificus DSM 13166]|uniref:Sirohydrochlorin cobaltochelatase n=1 Tax=Ignicoccus pacificus DSM 13166 TaxID=940294 RepID=A0A977KB60_9CREN|nr:hypothetical protein IPA_04420 [Ignicoccus pacificus DSM 13166]
MTAFVLIAHGSKNPKFQEIVLKVAKELENKEDVKRVYVGFLMGKPSIEDAIKKAAANDDILVIVPFFIAEGSHVVQDIRRKVEEVVGNRKKVVYAKALGDHPLIVETLYQRYLEAVRE